MGLFSCLKKTVDHVKDENNNDIMTQSKHQHRCYGNLEVQILNIVQIFISRSGVRK